MPKVSRKEFFNKLNNATLICMYGEERYLVHHSTRLIIKNAVEGGPEDFNVDSFYSDTNKQKVLSSINTLPIMSYKRVVVIKNIESCAYLNDLSSEIENLPPTTVLVLTGNKIDLRKSFFKSVVKNGLVVEFAHLSEDKLVSWVNKKLNEYKKADLEVSKMLLSMVGVDMYCLENEIMKVVNFVGEKEVVETSDVRAVCSKLTSENIFDFSKHLALRDKRKALSTLNELLLNSDSNPIGILALIKRHFRILLILKEAKGASESELASMVGVPRYFLRDYISESEGWSVNDLREVYDLLFETDINMKSSPVPDDIFLTNLVLKTTEQ